MICEYVVIYSTCYASRALHGRVRMYVHCIYPHLSPVTTVPPKVHRNPQASGTWINEEPSHWRLHDAALQSTRSANWDLPPRNCNETTGVCNRSFFFEVSSCIASSQPRCSMQN